MMTNISVGDIVEVTRNDGRKFESFVVQTYPKRNMFYGRVLESSRDKVSTASWDRYGLKDNGVCQVLEDCKSVKTISKGVRTVLEDMNDTVVYRNTIPGTCTNLTFCLSEGYGGWSESEEDGSIFESYVEATHSKANSEVEKERGF